MPVRARRRRWRCRRLRLRSTDVRSGDAVAAAFGLKRLVGWGCGGGGVRAVRQSRGRVSVGARVRRSALWADCAVLLGFGARRGTRCVRCAHCARTTATSQITKRAARAAPNPALLAAAHARPQTPAHVFARRDRSLNREKASRRHRACDLPRPMAGSMPAMGRSLPPPPARASGKAGGGRRAQRLCGGEQRRVGGGARSAPRDLTRRGCLSAVSAANEASSATRHQPEQRSAVGPLRGPTTAPKRSTPPAPGFAPANRNTY
jgi:hypothetical protein